MYDAATGAILENMSDNDAPIVDDWDRVLALGQGGSLYALKPFYAAFSRVKKLWISEISIFERMPQ